MKKLTTLFISVALIVLLTGLGFSAEHGNTTNDSFNKAKKALLRDVYRDHRVTFYCGCPFNDQK